jgi:CheY-specific phosphatase CheX
VRKKVLLVTTNQTFLRDAINVFNTDRSYKVISASDGKELLYRVRNEAFHIILMDYELPKIGGQNLIFKIRDTEFNEGTPLLVVESDVELIRSQCRQVRSVYPVGVPLGRDVLAHVNNIFTPKSKTSMARGASMVLDVKFINPFLEALNETLKVMCGVMKVSFGKPFLLKPEQERSLDIEISGVVIVDTTNFRGGVYLSFSLEAYLTIAEVMLSEKYQEICKDNVDLAAELVSIVYGNAKKVLNENGYTFKKVIPEVKAESHSLLEVDDRFVMVVPVISDMGKIYLSVAVKN